MTETGREQRINELSELIWNYHLMHHSLQPSDCIFALGCHDEGVANHAANLFNESWAPWLVISGGVIFDRNESAIEKIIIENKATNTVENFQFTRELLNQLGHSFKRFIVVQKPYMERRTFATGMA